MGHPPSQGRDTGPLHHTHQALSSLPWIPLLIHTAPIPLPPLSLSTPASLHSLSLSAYSSFKFDAAPTAPDPWIATSSDESPQCYAISQVFGLFECSTKPARRY
ncbi:hypothetical protein VPH35_035507 [Triticum aestivum]